MFLISKKIKIDAIISNKLIANNTKSLDLSPIHKLRRLVIKQLSRNTNRTPYFIMSIT